jgi:pyruvate,water dikinase
MILKVGGARQHGALVAREYGKPCIAGIENAIESLQDGQEIEMDGLNGIVHML